MSDNQTLEASSADISEILRMLPHRYPFLLIDAVKDIYMNESAVGVKMVTINEPHFQGHFPEQPVMPGVLIVEAMAQTAGVLVGKTLDLIDKGMLVYFMSMDKVKFRQIVKPGDALELHVKVIRGRGKIWKFSGEGMVNGAIVAEAEFTAMIVPPEEAK